MDFYRIKILGRRQIVYYFGVFYYYGVYYYGVWLYFNPVFRVFVSCSKRLVAPKKGIRPILSHRSLRLKKRQSMGRNNFRILKSPQRSPFQSQTFISQLYTSVLIVKTKSLTNRALQILSRQNIFEKKSTTLQNKINCQTTWTHQNTK